MLTIPTSFPYNHLVPTPRLGPVCEGPVVADWPLCAATAGAVGVRAVTERTTKGAPGAGVAPGVCRSVWPPAVVGGATGAGVWPGGEPVGSAAIVGPVLMRSVKSNKKLETPSHPHIVFSRPD